MDYGQCKFIHAIRFMNSILNNQLICQHPGRNSRYFVSFFSPFPRNGRGRSLRIRPSASAPLATLSPMAPPKCCTTSDPLGWSVLGLFMWLRGFRLTYCSLTDVQSLCLFCPDSFSDVSATEFPQLVCALDTFALTLKGEIGVNPSKFGARLPALRYVRIDYPTDTVPGSWQQSSRNSKLQGALGLGGLRVPYRWFFSAYAPRNYCMRL